MVQYDDLTTSPPSFRLLTLKAASHSTDPITCILTSHIRHSSPKYTTLSYTWGNSSPSKSITVNDEAIPIGSSLESALRHLRLPHDDLIIWVDALCINQGSDPEKSAQVQQMRDIYAESEQTFVWLGEGSSVPVGGLEELGKELNDLGAIEKIDAMKKMLIGQDKDAYEKANCEITEILMPLFLEYEGRDPEVLMRGYRTIYTAPYWMRVWIQQEIASAQRVTFVWGSSRISFWDLRACLFFMPKWQLWRAEEFKARYLAGEHERVGTFWLDDFFAPLPTFSGSIFGLRTHYQSRNDEERFGLFKLLVRAHVTSDSNPRSACLLEVDRIYGLLGIAKDAPKLKIGVDYKKSAEILYTEVARKLVEAGHVDVLSYCQFYFRDFEGIRMPSWVPDWACEVRRPCGEYTSDTAFCASGKHKYENVSQGNEQSSILRLKGVQIDVIESTGSHWRPKTIGTPPLHLIGPYLAEIQNLCEQSDAKSQDIYQNPKDRQEAYWRIPIADQEMTAWSKRRASGHSQDGYHRVLYNIKSGSDPGEWSPALSSYLNMMAYLYFRRPFVSKKGYVGLGPEILQAGDVVCVFLGAKLHYILRPYEGGAWRLVGEAFVHGIMYGEFLEGKIGDYFEVFRLN